MEEWRDVLGFPGYQISSYGNIRSWLRRGRSLNNLADQPHLLTQTRAGPDRRLYVHMSKDGASKQFLTHRVVLLAFVGPCPDGMEACHTDGNQDNNHLDNLRWDTHPANERDKNGHGTGIRGIRNPSAKLTSKNVLEIRQLYADGLSASKIAKQYSVFPSAVIKIVTGQRWDHLGGPVHKAGEHKGKRMPKGTDNYFGQHPDMNRGENSPTAILTERQVITIRERRAAGESTKKLAQEYSVRPTTILHIAHGMIWKHVGGPIT